MDRDDIDKYASEIIGKWQELVFRAVTGRKNQTKELFQTAFKRDLSQAVKIIGKDAEKFAKNAVPERDYDRKAMEKLKSYGARDAVDIRLSTYMQIVGGMTQQAEHIQDDLQKYIDEENKKGKIVTIVKMREKIVEELKGNNGFVEYSNGAKQPVEKYASMLARTARIESSNVALLNTALSNGIDLVECNVVPNTCDICSVYQGRIYSISGNTKDYPSLYDTAFKKGYSIIHPNCRHQFFPYIPQTHTDAERKNLEKQTHRSWTPDGDGRNFHQGENARTAYAHSQSYLRQCNEEAQQYEAMKLSYAEQGKEPPYKSLGAFRRSYRMEKGTDGYEKTHYWRKNTGFKITIDKKQKQVIIKARKLSVDDYSSIFTKSKAEKKNTEILIEFINSKENANPSVVELYGSLSILDNLKDTGVDIKLSHGEKHAVNTTYDYYTRKLKSCTVVVPKLNGEDLTGQINTTLHEQMHFIDMLSGGRKYGQSYYSSSLMEVRKTFEAQSNEMSKDVKELFDKFNNEHKNIVDEETKRYHALVKEAQEEFEKTKKEDFYAYDKFEKANKNALKQCNDSIDYRGRNIMGGGVTALQDIYDALSGGKYKDDGIVSFGHGSNYYSSKDKRVRETLANYGALSVLRPDLIDLLKKDKPELVNAMDLIVKGMLSKIKEAKNDKI